MDTANKNTKVARSFVGTVVSVAASKTIVVKVETVKMNSKYHKQFWTSRKYHAHDEKGVAKVGDVVKIIASRPLSALKRWRLSEIVKPSK